MKFKIGDKVRIVKVAATANVNPDRVIGKIKTKDF